MDSYLPRQISQSDWEISSNCGKKRLIKNWIVGQGNSRVIIGLAIMVYEPLYHALQIW